MKRLSSKIGSTFSHLSSYLHIHMLSAHDLDGFIYLDELVFELFLLPLHARRLHTNRHLCQQPIHFLLILLELC